MTCGCTNNKRLDDNKKISLESMKILSIDNIIKLYQDGYRLEKSEDFNEMSIQPDIQSLTLSNPEIIDATIYQDLSDGLYYTYILWRNSGGYGYMSFEGYSPTYVYFRRDMCDNVSNTPLAWYIGMSTNVVLPSSLDFRAFKCNSDSQQNCTAITCSQRVLTSSFYGVYVRAKDTIAPNAPTGLTITPGDGQLSMSWNAVTNTDIFAYFVRISHGATTDAQGFLPSNIRNITIANLINGTTYSVEVAAYNYSFKYGGAASGSGTPAGPSPTLTTITISPAMASIQAATTQQLTATCKDQSNNAMTCPTLAWASNDNSIATVGSTGLVTGVFSGTANITASAQGKTSNISVITVTAPTPTLTTITISPATTTVQVGATQQFTAICKDQNNNTMTCPTLAWTSSDTTKGTINSSTGLFTGVATGSTNVTAKSGSIISNTAAVTVTVPTPVLTTITISPSSKTLSPGSIQTFTTTCKDQDNNTMTCPTLAWSVDNTAIGTITQTGVFTAISAGTTTIRATSGTIVGTASVTVSSTAPILTTITISPSTASVAPDSTKTFTATPKDQFGNTMTGITITWSVVNTGIGTINNSTGVFTAKSVGTTTIRATSGTVVGTATITVTTAPVQAGGGTILIAAVALLAAVMLMRRKPPSPSSLSPSPTPLPPT